LSLTSGAFSPRRLLPLAGEIAAGLLADSDTPQFLHSPSYRPALMAWARAEAQVRLLTEYLSGLELEAALAEVTAGTETEVRDAPGRLTRRSALQRVESAWVALHKAETRAMNLRSKLGLDPVSRARLGADLAETKLDLAKYWARRDQDREAR
jgi:hypothetical protein